MDNPEQIAAKIDALGAWEAVLPYNWAVKLHGCALPYFCTVFKDGGAPVRYRLLMVEGWQTFHDYVMYLRDRSFGYYCSPFEMPHYELIVGDGIRQIARHDTGFVPRPPAEGERERVARILWESYGVMMRFESDRALPMKYAGERAMFARIETAPGTCVDGPLTIPPPRPYVERFALAKDLVGKAKDIPFAAGAVWEIDLRPVLSMVTREPRPRYAYRLLAVAETSGAIVFERAVSIASPTALKQLWESLPQEVLERIVAAHTVPGEIRVCSPRVFRALRALGMEIPFKLSLYEQLNRLEAAYAVRTV